MSTLKKDNSTHVVDVLFSFSLFGLFVLIGICIILFGSKVYRSSASQLEENYTSRTALAYVSEKIRQADAEDAISLLPLSDETGDALVLTSTISDVDYRTYIYFYDGSLRELFVRADTTITLNQGTALLALSDFTIEQDTNGFYLLTATEESGSTAQLLIRPKSS